MQERKFECEAKVQTVAHGWQKIRWTLTDLQTIKTKLVGFKAWTWCNVFYTYTDNFQNFAFGQIASYTPRRLPTASAPTMEDVAAFVGAMKAANGGEIRHLTYLAVCNYIHNELKGAKIGEVGLSDIKFVDWQNIHIYRDLAFATSMLLPIGEENSEGEVIAALLEAAETLNLSAEYIRGGHEAFKRDLAKWKEYQQSGISGSKLQKSGGNEN